LLDEVGVTMKIKGDTMTTTPSATDIDVFLRKHRDFRGISERGLCVLVYRNGTCSVPVSALTLR
jgi:hypothetical protein